VLTCHSLPGRSHRAPRITHDLSPISASGFFTQALEVEPPGRDTVFRAYHTPPVPSRAPAGSASTRGPAGRGLSGSGGSGTLLVCHHGAGASGLSFAALAKAVRERDPELGVLAYDARGHGACSFHCSIAP
jgi:protein phosphatase methylesterase 1